VKNWFSFYKNNIQSWDILQKIPVSVRNKGLVSFFPGVKKIVFLTKLKTSSESDFRIVKMMNFLTDLFHDGPVNVQVRRCVSNIMAKGGKPDRLVEVLFTVSGQHCDKFLTKLMAIIKTNLVKKQVPYVYGIDDLGVVRIVLKDLGELGILDLRYDYFGWQDNFMIAMYFSTQHMQTNNLLLSYMNIKFSS
jgi:hypothetical protein